MKPQDDVTLGYEVDDPELARLLLTNSLEVFPDLSNKSVAARMKREVLEVGKVRGRLLAREQEETMRGSGPKVAQVSRILPLPSVNRRQFSSSRVGNTMTMVVGGRTEEGIGPITGRSSRIGGTRCREQCSASPAPTAVS